MSVVDTSPVVCDGAIHDLWNMVYIIYTICLRGTGTWWGGWHAEKSGESLDNIAFLRSSLC